MLHTEIINDNEAEKNTLQIVRDSWKDLEKDESLMKFRLNDSKLRDYLHLLSNDRIRMQQSSNQKGLD